MTKQSSDPKQWHDANCHCQKFKYRVFVSPIAGGTDPQVVMNCTCSICTKNGYLNVYPHRDEIWVKVPTIEGNTDDNKEPKEVHPGAEELRTGALAYYVFGEGDCEHAFCKTCGSSLWVDAKGGHEYSENHKDRNGIVACNVRMFKDVQVPKLKLVSNDGWSWEPRYEVK